MSNIDQMQNWVKLKSVWTLLRIACLANRKSYVPINVNISPNVKMYQVEVGSNMAQNRLFRPYEVFFFSFFLFIQISHRTQDNKMRNKYIHTLYALTILIQRYFMTVLRSVICLKLAHVLNTSFQNMF